MTICYGNLWFRNDEIIKTKDFPPNAYVTVSYDFIAPKEF